MRFSPLALLVPAITLPHQVLSAMDEQLIINTPVTASNLVAEDGPATFADLPSLSDQLTIQNSASIFYSYARDTILSKLFDQQEVQYTLLVPTNRAVMALARKPHQGPSPGDLEDPIHISEQEYDKQSRKNVENWISAHIIPHSSLSFDSETTYNTLLEGTTVTVKPLSKTDPTKPAWSRVMLNDEISIISEHQASNGVLYLVDTAIYG